MKIYKIKYQKGFDIYIDNIKANSKPEAVYFFYMNNKNVDILDIKEVDIIEHS
ncbi:MAG: hypothetical protein HFJ20_06320 [Clostridia bacterium]|nr:hypothetical protein [Clostridia bacterium]